MVKDKNSSGTRDFTADSGVSYIMRDPISFNLLWHSGYVTVHA